MTPQGPRDDASEMVAQRIFDGCADLAHGESGIVVHTSPLTIAVRVLCDVVEDEEIDENALSPAHLGQIVAYITARVRWLWPDDWRSAALDTTASEIARHVRSMLRQAGANTKQL